MTRRLAAAAVLALALGGCGAPPRDLFGVERSGADRAANLRVVVDDGGRAICNRDVTRALDAEDLLEARALERDLRDLAVLGIELPPGPKASLRYEVETDSGPVAFSDTSLDRPPALDRLVAFVKHVGEDLCGISR